MSRALFGLCLALGWACDSHLVVAQRATTDGGASGNASSGAGGTNSQAGAGGSASGASAGSGGADAADAGEGGSSGEGAGGAAGAAGSDAFCASALKARDISAGHEHACAVTLEGDVYCWGSGQAGQLGNSDTVDTTHPVRATTVESFERVVALGVSTCALSANAELFCWGDNFDGVLADGTTQSTAAPVSVLQDVSDFAATVGNVIATTSDAQVWTWGGNPDGQLGLGTDAVGTTVRETTEVVGQSALDVASGSHHDCLLDADGRAHCAGSNLFGQLGWTGGDRHTFGPIDGDILFARIDAGHQRTCGLTASGSAYCWGHNDPMIIPEWPDIVRTPVRLGSADGYSDLSVGFAHVCMIRDERLFCLGGNEHGELGREADAGSSVPVEVPGNVAYSRVSAGELFTCAIRAEDSIVVCFGKNQIGQLGRPGDASHAATPVCRLP